jgi:hypothetical protein
LTFKGRDSLFEAVALGRCRAAGRKVTVVHPPVETDFARFVERTHDQPNPNRQQFHFGQRDLDVAAHEEALVQDAVEDLDQPCRPGTSKLNLIRHD